MPYYSYEGRDASDVLQQGTLEAATLAEALEQLQTRGLSVNSIALTDATAVVAATQQQQFHARLKAALSSRQQWIPALKSSTQELPAGRLRRQTERLIHRLSQDISAEQFLQDPAAVALFPWLVNNSPGANATEVADQLRGLLRPPTAQSGVPRSWIYPAVLMVMVSLLLVAFAHFLIPIFREMYGEFGLTLPPPTRWTFWIADQITEYWLRTLIIGAVLIAVLIPGVRWWRRRALTNRLFGSWISGSTANLFGMARLTQMLAELLTLGAPLSEALRIAGRASQHFSYERAATALAGHTAASDKLPVEASSRELPPSVMHALRADPSGRPNIPLLRSLAQIYTERASSRRDWVNTIFPAVGVVVIGIGIGFVMIALFLPMVSLVTALA